MIPDQHVYLLKDVSRLSGHSIHTIKFYLKLGLIQEAGRSPETRFRYFDHRTLDRLSNIRALRKERKSLAEIRQLLEAEPDQERAKRAGSGASGVPGAAGTQPESWARKASNRSAAR